MPLRQVPSRVGKFKEWANKEVNNSTLSESATPHRTTGSKVSRTRRRRRKRPRLNRLRRKE